MVDLLEGANDHLKLQRWVQTKGGEAGFNIQVARGLVYETAAMSLVGYQRVYPQVKDWLAYWQSDKSVPPRIREQIASLSTNPTFHRTD